MSFPGADILSIANSIIDTQTVTYYKYKDRVTNDVGQFITEYEPSISIECNMQPISKNLYQQLGLDLQKVYWTMIGEFNFLDIGRDHSSDRVKFGGMFLQVLSADPWFEIDGWSEVKMVQLDKASGFGSGFGTAFAS